MIGGDRHRDVPPHPILRAVFWMVAYLAGAIVVLAIALAVVVLVVTR